MPLNFKINDENLGTFVADEKIFKRNLEELHKIVGDIKNGEKDLKKAAKLLKALNAKNPLFLRGQAILAEMYLDLDDENAVTETLVRGAKAALKVVPKDFRGRMDMENPDVQCFVRCHAGYAEALVAKGEYKEALAVSQRHLAFDPDDMFDRGRDLGELAVMAGETEAAARILEEQLETRPSANYSLGFLAFQKGDYARAITLLRRAFVLAPYTVDFLTGRLTAPNIFWEQGPNTVDYHENMAYVELMGGEMWTSDQQAREFMEWLSQSSLALGERSKMAGVSEKCLGAEDGEEMNAAVDEWNALLASINDESSAKLVREADDPEDGESLYPWRLYSKAQERILNGDEEDDDSLEDDFSRE